MAPKTGNPTKSAPQAAKKLSVNKTTLKNLTVRGEGPKGGRMKLSRVSEKC